MAEPVPMGHAGRAMGRFGRRAALLLALLLAGTGCASDAPQSALDPAGPYAELLDNLFVPVFWVAVVVFVLVEGVIVYAIFKWRSKDDDDELPAQMHGNTRLEIGWTILPALVLGLVAVFTIPVVFKLNAEPAGALNVNVTGQQFWWGYQYDTQPAYGIVEPDGITTANELYIPVDQDVYLTLTSRDVIHSFWAPRLNGKRDVVPGREQTWLLNASEPGAYSGQCAEFCGLSHANMRLKVVALDQGEWEEWLATMQRDPLEPVSGLAAEGFTLFEQKGCAGCHVVDGSFESVAADAPPAPNLTHLFSRDCFAGCIYDLNDRNELEEWIRNPQRKAGSLMVVGELTEPEIDALYAYLETLE